ncbi:chromobox -like protein [Labeo rohita]|uniref:Chromobox-like protein n=1 Tax=Labeo rohita TaxID=84645 RepID=A0A498MZP9_LABRO|nr:chromobox -like protein [Labeo rohita]
MAAAQRRVEDLEGELKRKIKLLEEERKVLQKETQKHQDHIDYGLDTVHQRISSLEKGEAETKQSVRPVLSNPVKPREVRKGRVILNLKVVDKAGNGGVANSKRTHVPSTQQSHFGRRFRPGIGSKVDMPKGQTLDELPPSNSSSEVSDGEPPSPQQTQSQHSSLQPKACATKTQDKHGAQPVASKNSSAPSALPSSPMFSSSSSASSSSEDNEHILDLSVPHEMDRRLRRRHPFSGRRPLKVPEVPVSEEPSEEEDLDWRPDMTSRCANVVVTDITANLLTVTIKEFCHPPSATPPPCYPKNISAQHDTKQPKHHPNKT